MIKLKILKLNCLKNCEYYYYWLKPDSILYFKIGEINDIYSDYPIGKYISICTRDEILTTYGMPSLLENKSYRKVKEGFFVNMDAIEYVYSEENGDNFRIKFYSCDIRLDLNTEEFNKLV